MPILLLLVVALVIVFTWKGSSAEQNIKSRSNSEDSSEADALRRKTMSRRDYYRKVYLKSDEWKRKRYVVLKRDNWCCVHCGARATQVHHKAYAPRNIGKEPIELLESVCKSCHDSLH